MSAHTRLSPSYKVLLALCLALGGGFLLIFINNAENHFYIDRNLAWNPLPILSRASYLIRTNGCTIPALDPFDKEIKDFIFTENVENCTDDGLLPLVAKNATRIWILRENLDAYNISSADSFKCCYKKFYRPKFVHDIESLHIDDRVKYGFCVNFTDSIEVNHEFVKIICFDNDTSIYEDYFAFVRVKKFDADTLPRNESDFNVVVLGIDAVSRMNFHRTMPRTLEFLRKYDAVELLGYNKVADNTFPNLVPALMGIAHEELKTTCYPREKSTFDNCPLMWNWYKEAGFVTALAEDSADLGTFNYMRSGFGRTPTDYYYYTFIHEAQDGIGRVKPWNADLCLGGRYSYRVFLDYVLDVFNTVGSYKLFGFFWEVTISHDFLNYPVELDEPYRDLLESLEKLKHLDKTVLIVMSDHGIRWGDIVATKQGRMEERLPFVYFLLPPYFRELYPVASANLDINSQSLTTPFDLHETLQDLKDPASSLTDAAIARRSREAYATKRAISLFLQVPGNRSCASAAIAEHWCTCHSDAPLDVRDAMATEAAQFLVGWLNGLLAGHRECAALSLGALLQASEVELRSSGARGPRIVRVVVSALPSKALLEATLRRDAVAGNYSWSLLGSVSRLNVYGKQSACMHDYNLKLYCYCK